MSFKKIIIVFMIPMMVLNMLFSKRVYAEDNENEQIQLEAVTPLPIQTGEKTIFDYMHFGFGEYYVDYKVTITVNIDYNEANQSYRVLSYSIVLTKTNGYIPAGKSPKLTVSNKSCSIRGSKVYVSFTVNGEVLQYSNANMYSNVYIMTLN